MADQAPETLDLEHISSECAACRIVGTLTAHREGHMPIDDVLAGAWSQRRSTLNDAILIARRECPAHRRAWSEGA